MSLPWFRMYAEFAGDPVVQSLAFEDQRHFVMLLCLKCSGALDRKVASRQRESIIVRGLGLDPLTAAEVKRRLLEVDLIDKNWQPRGWERRQFRSDFSTDRVRKYRQNKESGNVSETLPKRFGNGPDTDTDTDAYTEGKKEEISSYPPGLDQAAWELWVDYRGRIRKPLRAASIAIAQKRMAQLGSQQMEAVQHSIAAGYQGLFPPGSNRGAGGSRRKTFDEYQRELDEGSEQGGSRDVTDAIDSTARRVD